MGPRALEACLSHGLNLVSMSYHCSGMRKCTNRSRGATLESARHIVSTNSETMPWDKSEATPAYLGLYKCMENNDDDVLFVVVVSV
eukprot:3560698-Amphidinium_carterae.1